MTEYIHPNNLAGNMDTFDLLAELSGSENKVTTEKLYIKFMGNNHGHGAILSQLIFWTPKARVPGGWIAKTYEDWYEEIVVTERQVRQARKKLEAMGILETKIKKFNSNPTVHYKLNKKKLVDSILTFCQERNLHFVRKEPNILSDSINRRIQHKNTNISERGTHTDFDEIKAAEKIVNAIESTPQRQLEVWAMNYKVDILDIQDHGPAFANYLVFEMIKKTSTAEALASLNDMTEKVIRMKFANSFLRNIRK